MEDHIKKVKPDNEKINSIIRMCNIRLKVVNQIIKIHRKLLPASKDAGLTEFSFDSGFLGCQKCSSSY